MVESDHNGYAGIWLLHTFYTNVLKFLKKPTALAWMQRTRLAALFHGLIMQ
jgi:hypothetical protein